MPQEMPIPHRLRTTGKLILHRLTPALAAARPTQLIPVVLVLFLPRRKRDHHSNVPWTVVPTPPVIVHKSIQTWRKVCMFLAYGRPILSVISIQHRLCSTGKLISHRLIAVLAAVQLIQQILPAPLLFLPQQKPDQASSVPSMAVLMLAASAPKPIMV